MSNTANWTYTNIARVRPVAGLDKYVGKAYGAEYEIACTWTAESTRQVTDGGAEFISRHTIYTEDPRPRYGDDLMFEGSDGWEPIRARTNWDMSFFGETPDYKLVT